MSEQPRALQNSLFSTSSLNHINTYSRFIVRSFRYDVREKVVEPPPGRSSQQSPRDQHLKRYDKALAQPRDQPGQRILLAGGPQAPGTYPTYVLLALPPSKTYHRYQPMVLVSYKLLNVLRTINTKYVSFWACSYPTTLPRW